MISHRSKRLQSFLLKIFVFFILLSGQLYLSAPARIINLDRANNGLIKGHFVFDTTEANLEELIESSDRIFTGICTNLELIKKDKRAKLPVVRYTFKIVENIKGVNGKDKISFKQWEPTTRDAGYEINKKYVLFLHPDSILGLTSPVGFLQGQFLVEKDLNENETVVNKVNNSGLTKNLKAKMILFEDASEKGGKISYREFIEFVKYLQGKK